jgi:hypothetical protein
MRSNEHSLDPPLNHSIMQKWLRFGAVVSALLLALPARAEPQTPAAPDPVDQTLCGLIETAATANSLPKGFFTRLIWQESALRATATSPAGAQGVAQFMPGTAAERGLVNPFDPETAIPASAKFLAELSTRFGNLGLAAAAYNAGPARVTAWLAGHSEMPLETRAYVYAITTRTIEDWAKPASDAAETPKPPAEEPSCLSIVTALRRAAPADTVGQTPFAPWGVQLAGNFSKAMALAEFQRVRQRYQAILGETEPFVLASRLRNRGASTFFRVRMPASTALEAQRLCGKLRAAGGSCVVLRS